MTLATAIVGGLVCGYFFGKQRKALATFLAIWLAVLTFQTALLAVTDPHDVPPQAWEYVPFQVVILAIAFGMVSVGTKLRARRGS